MLDLLIDNEDASERFDASNDANQYQTQTTKETKMATKIITNNLFECEGYFPACAADNWDFYIEDPENREHVECENEDLPCWVEVDDSPHCLACAVRERLLTEEEIQAFDPAAWRHYQSLTETSNNKGN